jgi:cytochrome c biogenesis protein CcdA
VTPITVIGKTYIIGFDTPQTTGKEIQNLVIKMKKEKVVTSLGYDQYEQSGLSTSVCTTDRNIPCTISPQREFIVKVPFYGELNIEKYPLIIIASVLGFIDGFNPCAMWVLITFLIILLQVGNRKKMALFAGVFILAEAVMYTLILTVWFKTWDFVQLDTIITPVVGVVSIIGGFLFIKEFRKKELVCKVTNREERSKTYHKIKELATEKFTLITFIGILGVAFSVNIIEFACSIGIPQTFTKILEINNLNFIQSSVLILLYIFFYMFDDLVVFGLALYGADKLALTTKYSKWSNLIGGIVMTDLVVAAKEVAKRLDSAFSDVARTGMVFEGFGVDHIHAKLFPMHGTKDEQWKQRKSNVDIYFNTYQGYISSHDYKRADDMHLAEVAKKISR